MLTTIHFSFLFCSFQHICSFYVSNVVCLPVALIEKRYSHLARNGLPQAILCCFLQALFVWVERPLHRVFFLGVCVCICIINGFLLLFIACIFSLLAVYVWIFGYKYRSASRNSISRCLKSEVNSQNLNTSCEWKCIFLFINT